MTTNEPAKKNDEGKPSFSMIPQKAILEVSKTFTHGARKYGKFNYSGGMEMTRYLDAAYRHLNAVLTGEDMDVDSGCLHLSNAIASLLMALDNQLTGSIIDDRNKIYKKED